nr:hypothetical protein CFP56_52731 [Quercus suber]
MLCSTGFGVYVADGARADVAELQAWVGLREAWPQRPRNSSSPLLWDTPEETNDYTCRIRLLSDTISFHKSSHTCAQCSMHNITFPFFLSLLQNDRTFSFQSGERNPKNSWLFPRFTHPPDALFFPDPSACDLHAQERLTRQLQSDVDHAGGREDVAERARGVDVEDVRRVVPTSSHVSSAELRFRRKMEEGVLFFRPAGNLQEHFGEHVET